VPKHERIHDISGSDHTGQLSSESYVFDDNAHGERSTENAHSHTQLRDINSDDHHKKLHNLDGSEHNDVEISSLTDKEVLQYEASTDKWKNKIVSGDYGIFSVMVGTNNVIKSDGTYVVLHLLL